jgi:hypothetical protein
MREVLSSASEAKLAALFYNGKEGAPLRITLDKLGHAQPPTPMVTDNSTTSGIANESMKQKRSKAMDMRFYWIRGRVRQGQYHVYWDAAKLTAPTIFQSIILPNIMSPCALLIFWSPTTTITTRVWMMISRHKPSAKLTPPAVRVC